MDHDALDEVLDLAGEAAASLVAEAMRAGPDMDAAELAALLRNELVPSLGEVAWSAAALADGVVEDAVSDALSRADLTHYRRNIGKLADARRELWLEAAADAVGAALVPVFDPGWVPSGDDARRLSAAVESGQDVLRERVAVEAVERRMVSAADRLAKQAARDTVHQAVDTLNTRDGRRPARWYRRPRGDTCAFCLLLASRGPVYSSAFAAGDKASGNEYHDRCNCTPTLLLPGDTFAPDYDLQGYRSAYEQARKERAGRDLQKRPGARKNTNSALREALRDIRAQGYK